MRIAILGAECTGKTSLAKALLGHLHQPQSPWILFPELLREWCVQHQRTPRAEEQEGLLQTQLQHMSEGMQANTSAIADTTPLMTAIYSDLLFQDTSLYACALEHQRIYDLTLVTAPDIDWQADGFQRDGIATRAAVDRKLRSVLQGSAIPYAVICGTGEARTQSALDAIAHWQRTPRPRNTHDTEWKWSCDTCSDPQCEHRLFSRLLGSS